MQREDKEAIFSKRVRAGKRTYFFDVRATRANDYYLTITESRRQQRDGEFFYEKSKTFVYKEDFNKFLEALTETVDHIKTELNPEYDYDEFVNKHEATPNTQKLKDQPLNEDINLDKADLGESDLSWE